MQNDRKQEEGRRLASNPLHLERRTRGADPVVRDRNNACRHHRKMGIHKSQRAGFTGASEIGARWILLDERRLSSSRPPVTRYDELDSLDRLFSVGFFVTTFLVAVFFVGCLWCKGACSVFLLRLLEPWSRFEIMTIE
jgi:hypothetical protein